MNSVVFLFGRSPYHQVCPHNLVGAFSLVPVQLVCKDAECAFAHFFSVLLYGGQFRVGALGDGSVGETADGTSSGTFSPTSLQAYNIPAAVSSLIAKKPSGRLSLSSRSGVWQWRVHGCRTVLSCCRPPALLYFLHGIQIRRSRFW